MIKRFLFFILLLSSYTLFSNPFHKWNSIESEHFILTYNEETAHLKEEALQIAEETVDTVAYYFGVEPIKFHVVLTDDEDTPSGGAYVAAPLAVINCRKVNMLWRGETYWLRAVLSHELSHLYTINLMKSIPVYFSIGASTSLTEREINGGGSLLFHPNDLPKWFVEGLAQLGSLQYGADFRDPYREMLLRDAYYNNLLLNYDQMCRFEGSSRESELAYNQGFDLMVFIRDQYQQISIRKLCRDVMKKGFAQAIVDNYHKTIEQIYLEWKSSLAEKYNTSFEAIPGSRVLDFQPRILNIETAFIPSGHFLISNWRYDYEILDLLKFSGGRITDILAEDVGRVLKKDPVTGKLYFSKNIYRSGVMQFDLFELNHQNKVHQITENARPMAFDAYDGRIFYAGYKNTINSLMVLNAGYSKSLYNFDYDVAVDSISCFDENTLYLTLGTGDKVKAAVFEKNTLNYLWPDITGDILDLIVVDKQKLVFVSTITGIPQLYWCELSDTDVWYSITNVAGGIRYPAYDEVNGELNCSVYQGGHWKIHNLNDPFKKYDRVLVTDYLSKHAISQENADIPKYKPVFSGLVPFPVTLFLDYDYGMYPENPYASEIENIFTTGMNLYFRDPQGNLQLETLGAMNFFTGESGVLTLYPDFKIQLSGPIGIINWLIGYRMQNTLNNFNSSPDEYINKTYTKHILNSEIECNILDKFDLNIDYEFNSVILNAEQHLTKPGYVYIDTGTTTIQYLDNEAYSAGHWINLYLSYFDYLPRFDPARIGSPYFSAEIGSDYTYHAYTEKFGNDFGHAIKAYGYLGLNLLTLFNKMSIKTEIDGFYFENLYKDGLYFYRYLGTENLFSGYPYEQLEMKTMARTQLELRINPFVVPDRTTHWYERMHLGLKAELGYVNYYTNNSTEWGWPLSLEAALRYYFYLTPNASSIYVKAGFPVLNVGNILFNQPYRIYFGFSIR
ncbi:MAG: hypothetical protein JXR48_07040 [Candidatus Delongbacteria bacterium]|nr:hypothetical protein [Candidatus Delongbacteria bacterium]